MHVWLSVHVFFSIPADASTLCSIGDEKKMACYPGKERACMHFAAAVAGFCIVENQREEPNLAQ